VTSAAEVVALQAALEDVYIDRLLRRWVIELVRATRALDFVTLGASVRGSLALERAARAWALSGGRDHVEPEDVEALFLPLILHRLVIAPEYLADDEPTQAEVGTRVWDACLARAPRPAPAAWDAPREALAAAQSGR